MTVKQFVRWLTVHTHMNDKIEYIGFRGGSLENLRVVGRPMERQRKLVYAIYIDDLEGK